jgi:hypothetical protein
MYRISSLSRLTYATGIIDYVKLINKKVGTANSGKEFSEITENNKSRKIKEFESKAETALWFVESYGLQPVCFRIYMILDVPDKFAF